MGFALLQARLLLARLRADAVCVMGGYVSLPVGIATKLFQKVPLLVHEQNAHAGMTNQILSRFAEVLCTGLPGPWPHQAQCVGNPIHFIKKTHVSHKKPRVLVLGGSQGASFINAWVMEAWHMLPVEDRPELWHQVGAAHLQSCQAEYARCGIKARIDGFIDEMAEAYAWADLVIARAGAMTISELWYTGCPAVLVPLPTAVDDHQTANAKVLVATGQAELWSQESCTTERLCDFIRAYDFTKSPLTREVADAAATMVTWVEGLVSSQTS
jgi:UDP-N-acetylglucosamine--N-acetylmuramyl-(pentapeptide) pyrophosphoryl-undecaprenol N-acetylglucosamine transferase